MGFALIWRIYWFAGLGLVGAVAIALIESWKTDLEMRVPAEEVTVFEQSHAVPALGAPSGGFERVHAIDDARDRVGVASGGRS